MTPPLGLWRRIHKVPTWDLQLVEKTSDMNIPPLFRKPVLKILERDDSVTRVIHETPVAVQVSRLFTVPNDSVDVCPLIDLSELNSFVDTLRTRMKHLEATTRLLEEPSGAAKVSASPQHLRSSPT